MAGKGLGSLFSRLSSSHASSSSTGDREKKLLDTSGSPNGVPKSLRSKALLPSLQMASSRRERHPRSGGLPGRRKYFGNNNGTSAPGVSSIDTILNKMFEDLRDPSRDTEQDSIGVESTMKYLQDLHVDPESCEIFVVLDVVRATNLGEITRKGFVEGWKESNITASTAAHRQYLRSQVQSLRSDLAYFRRVYRHVFVAGKEPDQKSLGLENAIVYWDMLFSAPGRPWASGKINWLALWKQFLGEKWTRSVNRDMWHQTLEFALRSIEDDTLNFWNEDGAWPSVIDDFVQWCKDKGVAGDHMALDG